MKQTQRAIDILKKHYPDEDYILVFNNTTTHLKWPEGAHSAQNMLKFTLKEGSNWGLETNLIGKNGKTVHTSNGKVVKIKIPMVDAGFSDGSA